MDQLEFSGNVVAFEVGCVGLAELIGVINRQWKSQREIDMSLFRCRKVRMQQHWHILDLQNNPFPCFTSNHVVTPSRDSDSSICFVQEDRTHPLLSGASQHAFGQSAPAVCSEEKPRG